jgi:DNA processing protein
MSGLSRGSVVIEASERSGARVQARLALAHGRPVFLLDRLMDQPWARELASHPDVHAVRSPGEVCRVIERGLQAKDARHPDSAPQPGPAPQPERSSHVNRPATRTSWRQ